MHSATVSPIALLSAFPLLLALAVPAPAAEGEDPLPALARAAAPSIVTVVAYNPDRAMPGLGTGFVVEGGLVATARHVVAGADRAEVRAPGGRTVRVTALVAEDRDRDLALLRVEPALESPPLRLRAEAPLPGERLFAVSGPLGLEGTVSDGVASALREIPGVGAVLQHTVAVSPGSSGGPILDLRGAVVGIQSGTITTPDRNISAGQGLNFAVPAAHLTALRPGDPRSLADCRKDLPPSWVPAITSGVDRLGLRALVRDDFEGALAFFEECARRESGDADAWFRLGICRERIGRLDGAAEAYSRSLEIRSEQPVARNNLGNVRLRQGQPAEAAEEFRRAVTLRPDSLEALVGLSEAGLRLGRHEEAATAAEKALRVNRGHADARFHLGMAQVGLGQLDRAREGLEELRKLDAGMADRLKGEIERAAAAAALRPKPKSGGEGRKY